MAFKYNPLSGQIEDQQQGPQGPAGTVTTTADVGGGTAASPAYKFQNDSDTGVFSAGADTIGLSTGGTGRLFITSAGTFGFNTSTVREIGHIHKTSSEEAYLRFTNTTTGTGAGDGFNIGISPIEDALIWNKENTNMYFGTNSLTRLTIKNDGKVGIGTGVPTQLLHVHSGALSGGLHIQSNGSSNYIAAVQSTNDYVAGAPAGSLAIRSASGIYFSGNGGTNHLALNPTGAVGIGTVPAATSSNTKRLALGAKGNIWGWTSGNVDGALTIADNYYVNSSGTNKIIETGNAAYLTLRNGGLNFGTTDTTYSAGATVGLNEKFRITNDGKVGINISTPTYQLSTYGTGGTRHEIVSTDNNSAGLYMRTLNSDSMVSNVTLRTSNNGDFQIYTGTSSDAERFKINSSGDAVFTGNVGIGADPGSNALHIENGDVRIEKDTKATIGFRGHTSGSTALAFRDSNAGEDRFTINADGSATFTGNVGIGIASPSSKLYVNGTTNGLQARFGGVGTGLGISLGQKTNPNALVSFLAQDSTYGTFRFVKGTSTEQLRITADGDVGIGTTTPNANLQVVGQGFFTAGDTDPGDSGRLVVEGNKGYADSATNLATSTTQSVLRIKGSNNSSDSLWIGTLANGTFGHHDPYIQGANGNGSAAKDIAIQPYDGNVGIGTDSPNAKLTVHGSAGNAKIRLGQGGDYTMIGPDSAGHTIINAGTSGGDIELQASGSPKLTIKSTGKVGIGTDAPNEILQINQAGAVQTIIGSTNGGGAWLILDGDSNGDGIGSDYSSIVHNSDGLVLTNRKTTPIIFKNMIGGSETEALRISDGDTKIPSDKYLKFNGDAFTIRENAGNNYINSQTGSLYLQGGGNTAIEVKNNKDVEFSGDVTAQRLTLEDGPATASPIFMLKTDDHNPWSFIIKNDSYSTSIDHGFKAYQSNAGDFYLRLQGNGEYNSFYLRQHNGTDNRDLVAFDTSGDATFKGWVYGDRFINSTTSEDPWLKGVNASGTETSYVKKDGTAYFAGDVKLAAAKGIQFGSTAGANHTLDDYEEGTHNPTDQSGANLTLQNNNTGIYTKIGGFVHFCFDITFPSTSNTSDAVISAPFMANQDNHGGGVIGYTDLGRPAFLHMNTSGLHLRDHDGSGDSVNKLSNANCSGKRFIGQVTFRAT